MKRAKAEPTAWDKATPEERAWAAAMVDGIRMSLLEAIEEGRKRKRRASGL